MKINRKLLSTHLKKHIGPEHTGEILGIEVTLEDSCNIEERQLLNLDFKCLINTQHSQNYTALILNKQINKI